MERLAALRMYLMVRMSFTMNKDKTIYVVLEVRFCGMNLMSTAHVECSVSVWLIMCVSTQTQKNEFNV